MLQSVLEYTKQKESVLTVPADLRGQIGAKMKKKENKKSDWLQGRAIDVYSARLDPRKRITPIGKSPEIDVSSVGKSYIRPFPFPFPFSGDP